MDFANLFSLEGKVALVTGGSRGIGKMIVEGFLAAGCERIYITARKAQVVEETAAEFGDKVIGLPGDISRMEGIDALVAEIGRREERARHPGQQRRRRLGCGFRGFPRDRLGQGHGP